MTDRPVYGRASAASEAPWKLRQAAAASDAAIRADGGDLGPWVLRVASLAGVRHRLAGTGPEDAYAWAVAGGVLRVAVADGVGSVAGSAAASAAAASAAVAEGDLGEAISSADGAVRAAGGATTLVVASIDAHGHAEVHRVGDSSAWVLAEGTWREVWGLAPAATEAAGDGSAVPGGAGPGGTDADAGADADGTISTATAALPSSSLAQRVERAAVDLAPGAVLVLVTDGVSDPLRDGPTTVAPGLAAALEVPVEPVELARIVDFSRQGVGDDRTLLAVWVRAGDL